MSFVTRGFYSFSRFYLRFFTFFSRVFAHIFYTNMLVSKPCVKTQEKCENSARNLPNVLKTQEFFSILHNKNVSRLRFSRVLLALFCYQNLTKMQPQCIVYYVLKDIILITSPLIMVFLTHHHTFHLLSITNSYKTIFLEQFRYDDPSRFLD